MILIWANKNRAYIQKEAPEAIKNFWGVSFYLNIYRARACTRNNTGQNSPEHSKTIIFS